MCGTCDCGLHDCPGHSLPEPEQCKDPAHGGPEGGDCGWTNRCRGSLDGCKLGCKLQQSAGRSSWGFVLVLWLSSMGYVGGGVGLRMKRNGAPCTLASHPHYRQWQELGGLVVDGVKLTQAKLTGRPIPRPARGDGGSSAGYSTLSAAGASPPSTKGSKHKAEIQAKDHKKKSKTKSRSSQKTGATLDSDPIANDGIGAVSSSSPASAGSSEAAKDTASAGGGRWVHVPG